ncbi:DUF418 domain-containing protein [Pseudoalteromonas luteoviolacea]|uniref:DUF418 domain-containing protein n=1 Tax=Pseudoalteromonas luteoviolacea S4054 TaxID=1129367 RepID=A0A0F6A5X5_9GAMM|nr:DUF418 domain-containing protein [Pseudoalteromonas luteoviolacea]AOT10557.1 hypothetical protein S4054249_22100 [Pseudoalteromonas luteoviolacea]AOT15375.1 hypothetical protein S40542_21495 [Pseudoalteromonas luteoviolacea]AOT20376.1 hypothetical protein S4054_22015 [Pseudoalteromonas luteoviolacea]KKE81513.1 hypothetical protein N479_03235 [Pseudoalteromonas luteoviolacea S4054]KZN71590.1 hypothetical protein N481_18145 [Pseudoalteromonas luteoviolacea S4047-1]
MRRIEAIDFLRGIAVIGLPLTNLMYMANFTSGSVAPSSQWSDEVISYLADIFAHGKFRTVFSILFGLSLCLLHAKLKEQRGAGIKSRLLILGGIGCIHGFVVWPGDILLNYALSGLLVLSVIRLDTCTLIKLVGCTILIPIGILILLIYQGGEQTNSYHIDLDEIRFSILGLLAFNFENYLSMLVLLPTITLWYVFGLMLIGVLLYRAYWQVNTTLPLWLCVFILIPLSVISSIVARSLFVADYRLIYDLLNWLCAIPLSVALVCIALNYHKAKAFQGTVFSYAGKNSLSLYLMQSVLGVWLFQFAFPTWKIYFTHTDYFLLFISFTTLQLALVWCFYRMSLRGPAEWGIAHCQKYFNRRE